MSRRIFMHEQESLDMAWGCISEGHTWEALRDAVFRMGDFIGLAMVIPAGQYGAFTFGEKL